MSSGARSRQFIEREVTVKFRDSIDHEQLAPQGELVETTSTVVYRRQQEAVTLLRNGQSVNPHLLDVLVDHKVRSLSPDTAEPCQALNDAQLEAFRKGLATDDLLLVLGPPGTGKTHTIRQIVEACTRRGHRVLVTAHTHRAVDNVIDRWPADLECIRVGPDNRVTDRGKAYLLDVRAGHLCEDVRERVQHQLSLYSHLEDARRWRDELERRVGQLDDLTADLATADRHVERAEWRSNSRGIRRLGSLDAKRDRLQRRLQSTNRRRLLPLGLRAELTRRRRKALTQVVAGYSVAERQLETSLTADPDVAAARGARTRLADDVAECARAATAAADAACDLIGGIDVPGQPLDSVHTTLAWLSERIPVLANRAGLLRDWMLLIDEGPADQLHPELIRYADVIAVTCASADNAKLPGIDFDLVLLDEAGQVGIATSLIPLVRARRAVLVGDDKQLPPFVDNEVKDWGESIDAQTRELLSKSAFELLAPRLPDGHVVMLREQRRMPHEDFLSRHFYGGKLVTVDHPPHSDGYFDRPLAFIDTSDLTPEERHESQSTSSERWGSAGITNDAEARLLVELAVRYSREHRDWAIILPYRAQRDAIRQSLWKAIGDSEHVRSNVGTVDSFQGGEREVVLFGFTRSNQAGRVGFLGELRRTNVAFSRAKDQLVLVGDLYALRRAQHSDFRDLVSALCDQLDACGRVYRSGDVLAKLSDPEWRGRL